MKKLTAPGADIRIVLTGMITDPIVISRISEKWTDEGLFGNRWCNRIAGWCIRYYRKYEKPIGKKIEAVFERWAAKPGNSPEVVEKIDSFLCGLSNEYEITDVTPKYVLDRAALLFDKIRLMQAVSDIEGAVDTEDLSKAYETINALDRIDLGAGKVLKPCEDLGVWADVYGEESKEILVPYKKRMHDFLGKWFTRDSLYAYQAPDKIGKSCHLLDVAIRGLRNRKKVAYFDTGDMSEDQVLSRMGSRAARVPLFPCTIEYPISVTHEGEVESKTKIYKKGMTSRIAFQAMKRLSKRGDSLRLMCYPNSTVSILDIISQVNHWAREGFIPDIIIIDYSDILAPPAGSHDGLDEIDRTWKLMRRLSQEMHCLVVTATQSNAAAYKKEGNQLLGKKHFSGRKTKMAHVNGMIGINVLPGDKEKGICRLNWIVRREGAWSESEWFTMAGCWDYYSPAVAIESFEKISRISDNNDENFR